MLFYNAGNDLSTRIRYSFSWVTPVNKLCNR